MLRLLSSSLLKLTESLLIRNWVWHWWRLMILEIVALVEGLCIELLRISTCWIINHFLRVGCTALRTLVVIEAWGLCATIVSLRRFWLNHHRRYHIERRVFIAYSSGFNLRELSPSQLLESTQRCCTRRYRIGLRILFAHHHWSSGGMATIWHLWLIGIMSACDQCSSC